MSRETTAIRILIAMKRFASINEVIWTRKMISDAINENYNEIRLALRFLERRGYVCSIRHNYNGEICVEYNITSEGHQAVLDSQFNPRADRGAAEWIRYVRQGITSDGRQSRLTRVAIPKGGFTRDEISSMEDELDARRENEQWADDESLPEYPR